MCSRNRILAGAIFLAIARLGVSWFQFSRLEEEREICRHGPFCQFFHRGPYSEMPHEVEKEKRDLVAFSSTDRPTVPWSRSRNLCALCASFRLH